MERQFRNLYLELREVVISYLGGKCENCGSTKKLKLHHKTPLNRGGTNSLGNLQVLCKDCHSKIHQTIEKFLPKEKNIIPVKCSVCGKIIERKHNSKNVICKICVWRRYKKLPPLKKEEE